MGKPDTINFERLETGFQESGCDALVVASGENILYFSGVPTTSVLGWERIALVVWPREASPTFIVCNVDESLAKAGSWIEDVRSYIEFAQSPIQLLAEVLKERGLYGKTIGVEKRFLTAAQYEEMVSLLPSTEIVACDRALASIRAIKTDEEIRLLREAFNVAEKAIHQGFSEAKVGMTHKTVLDEITARAAAQGADRGRSSFASGDTPPHSEVGAKKLQFGDVIRIDFVGQYNGYYYDIGRTAVVGEPSPEVQDRYHRRWRVQRKVIEFMAPGVRACEVYWRALDAFSEEGLLLAEVGPHIGHCVGIGIHESPLLQPYEEWRLEPNMTFCIEPRYSVPGVGVFHIEDLVRITETGSDVLSDLYDTSELFVIGG